MPSFTVKTWWTDQTQQGGSSAAPFDLGASGESDAAAADLLGEKVNANNLRAGLKLLGAEGVLDVLQKDQVDVDLYEPGSVVGRGRGGRTVEMSDNAIAWTRWRGETRSVYINQNVTVEQAVLGLLHEYTHLLGGDEVAAWSTTVENAIRLERLGGAIARQDPIAGLVGNGHANPYAVEAYVADQKANAASPYSITGRQIYPISVTPIY